MAMGLVGCHPDELVEIDDRYPAEMAERRELLATRHAEVFAASYAWGLRAINELTEQNDPTLAAMRELSLGTA